MLQIPPTVLARFDACLAAENISENLRGYYKKWLRFYLDFCLKYHHDANNSDSIAEFQKKLLEKGQAERQRQQASHAIHLYLNIDQAILFSTLRRVFAAPAVNNAENANTRADRQTSATNKSPLDTAPHRPCHTQKTLNHNPETTRWPMPRSCSRSKLNQLLVPPGL